MKKILLVLFLITFGCQAPGYSQGKYKVYAVANSHLDTQWNWDVQTTINVNLKNTLNRNLYLLRRFPDYIFNFEGAVKYNWMKEYYPLEYEEVKKYIREGRWHVTGSSWDANDTNIPSPESFFRNILLGQEFYQKEFNLTSTDIFLPDCFGFSYTLPTIAAHAGLIGFSTQKLQWRKHNFFEDSKIPFSIGLWEGVDGARIMAAFNGNNYDNQWDGEDISHDSKLIELAQKGVNSTAYRYYGNSGDRGGATNIASVISVEKGLRGDGPVNIVSSTSDRLYKDYLPFDKHPELPVYKGELLMDVHGTGCYTAQAAMKLYNRRNEQLGDAAERISVIADYMNGAAYPSDVLKDTWQRFIWHQFHDDLPGTSLPKAYAYSWNDQLISQSRFADIIRTGVGSVLSCMNTNVKGIPVAVYNPMVSSRNERVEVTLEVKEEPEGITVFSPEGKEVPSQILYWKDGNARIAFNVVLDPLSCSIFDIRWKSSLGTSPLKATLNTLENSVYKLTIDHNGDICSLIDKRYNCELVDKGKSFRLALFTENTSIQWPAWEISKKTLDALAQSITDNVKIHISEQGPSCVALRIERSYGGSRFIQTIRMTEGGCDDRIDVINEIDWQTKNALLKAEFPLSVVNSKATYDLGLGVIERGNNTEQAYEVCAQQWADVTAENKSYGVSILNNGRYGWDKPNDNTLRLTLIHAPKSEKRYMYHETQDFGHHTFTYSIVGHKGTPLEAGISQKAESLNSPLVAFTTPQHKGSLGRSYSMIQLNTSQVAVRSFKKAEDNDFYIIRLYELQGKSANQVKVNFPSFIEEAYEVNGIEKRLGKVQTFGSELQFDISAFQPKTFAVRLKKGVKQALSVNSEHLKLPYSENAFTPEHFGHLGDFDKEGHTYAAELIGNEVLSEDISFKIASRDGANVVKCKGDTIYLPEGKKYTKLYLLASSTDKDRLAAFKIDGKEYYQEVPYYSGFYGQWKSEDTNQGYIRNAPIAYIGSHRHNNKGRISAENMNDAYTFTYMYKLTLDLPKNAKTLILPNDDKIAIFAATLSDNHMDEIESVNEVRALSFK